MYLARTLAFPLLLLSVPACTVVEKDLLGTGFDPSSSTATGDGTEATGTPTTGTPTTGTTTEPTTGTDGEETGTTGPIAEAPPFLVNFGRDLLCMPHCVRDVDPRTIVVEPNCQVYEHDAVNDILIQIPKCIEVGAKRVIPPGALRCFAYLIDPGGLTPSKLDDMGDTCIDHGSNLEFFALRSEPLAADVYFASNCEPSAQTELDCPGLK